MIGYYVHHHGRGHLHRATALAAALDVPVTGLSSLPRPAGWRGDWLGLDRDDDVGPHRDVTAHGRLHWVPTGHRGLAARMAAVATWIRDARPDLLVVDVSVEVAVLARLHGVPVVCVAMPGRRDDAAHRLAYDLAAELVAFWPAQEPDLLQGVPPQVGRRVRHLGGMARFAPRADAAAGAPDARTPGPRRVTVLLGSGGDDVTPLVLAAAREQTPDWRWTVLGGRHGEWVEDPRAAVEGADVVVTHAGQNALAEVAALRRPAVVLPQPRPFDEQECTAGALARGGWPVVVAEGFPADGWAARLEHAAGLDGAAWARWCDGGAAARFAGVVESVREDAG